MLKTTITLSADTSQVTIESAKRQLNIIDSDSDTLIQELIDRAVSECELMHGSIVNSTKQLTVNEFTGNRLYISEKRINVIESVMVDDLEVEYKVKKGTNYSILEFTNSIHVNSTITVTYQCGYTTIPSYVMGAIMIKVADLYDYERNSYVSNSIIKQKIIERLLC